LREEPELHNTSAVQHKVEAPAECKKAIEAEGEFKKVPLDPRVPDKTRCIGTEASQQEQAKLLAFLDKNNDFFIWSTSDLVAVSKDIIEHQLQVSPSARPKKQKLRKMLEEKVKAAKVQVRISEVRFFPSSILHFPLIALPDLILNHSIIYSSSQDSFHEPGYQKDLNLMSGVCHSTSTRILCTKHSITNGIPPR
jgi:hypothetical protein